MWIKLWKVITDATILCFDHNDNSRNTVFMLPTNLPGMHTCVYLASVALYQLMLSCGPALFWPEHVWQPDCANGSAKVSKEVRHKRSPQQNRLFVSAYQKDSCEVFIKDLFQNQER